MTTRWLVVFLLFGVAALRAADLPTVTVEHLYYLQARAERVRRYKPDDMVAYCLTQKIGGASFDYLYSQLFNARIELNKLIYIQDRDSADPRVVELSKTIDADNRLLQEESQKIRSGILLEGQVATDSLQAIANANAQNGR